LSIGSPRPFYEAGLERCGREAERLERRSNVLSSMRLASVVLSLLRPKKIISEMHAETEARDHALHV
jgi:hypothetical protein